MKSGQVAGGVSKFRVPFEVFGVDFKRHPERYRVARGEQGVLSVEPYKSELLPHWRFKDVAAARRSARTLFSIFLQYKAERDFVGMDMARKFLQMGYTRSRRYANHRSGRKYDGPVPAEMKGHSGSHGRSVLPREPDPEKARCAEIFKRYWERAERDRTYSAWKTRWRQEHG